MKNFEITYPRLETQRLILREITVNDALRITTLLNNHKISRYLSRVPYPYTVDDANEWIGLIREKYKDEKQINFAIVEKNSQTYMGSIGFNTNKEHNRASIGYWLGEEYWGRGFVTEAGKELLKYGFEVLDLHRIYCSHFDANPASGKVMQKIGLKYEGRRVEHFYKGDEYFDLIDYGAVNPKY
jgi:RimJ/RimL family protein N-acetyltransferase